MYNLLMDFMSKTDGSIVFAWALVLVVSIGLICGITLAFMQQFIWTWQHLP